MKADGTGAPVTAPAKRDTIGDMIAKLQPQLAKALPKHVTADRLARVAMTAIRQSAALQQADPVTLMASIMVAAQLGLEPNTPLGQCYIIPYAGKAQFQIGYKGILDLAHNSKQYKRIAAYSVDERDAFDYAYGLSPFLTHIPDRKPTGNAVYYYAVYELDNGGQDFRVWSKEQVEAHAKQYSQAYKNGKKDSPWFTAFDSMAKKTVLIDLLRYAPKSVEIAQAVSYDNATLNFSPDDPEVQIHAEWEPMEAPRASVEAQ